VSDYVAENAGSKQQLPIAGLSLFRVKLLLKIITKPVLLSF
jgi:hypothetical protein